MAIKRWLLCDCFDSEWAGARWVMNGRDLDSRRWELSCSRFMAIFFFFSGPKWALLTPHTRISLDGEIILSNQAEISAPRVRGSRRVHTHLVPPAGPRRNLRKLEPAGQEATGCVLLVGPRRQSPRHPVSLPGVPTAFPRFFPRASGPRDAFHDFDSMFLPCFEF